MPRHCPLPLIYARYWIAVWVWGLTLVVLCVIVIVPMMLMEAFGGSADKP